MIDPSAAKDRLQTQLSELEARLERLARDLAEPLNRDSDEAAIEVEDDESLESQCALAQREIASVKRALARIGAGTYGICVRCGGDITEARLDARPEAALCISCAREAQ